ncbi:MAG: hypothetical protein JJU31_09485 [Wenzhouxiangella sp.]|nr:hypothetical protein [Wenzhouxiangella sp.]MCH8478552.1 hypothetical protein [Wenzhouxiangella sp.]
MKPLRRFHNSYCDMSMPGARPLVAGMLGIGLVLSAPAWSTSSEEEQARREFQERLIEDYCRDDADRPESWLDRSHSYMSQRLCEPAAWFDGFFGDPRSFEETPVGTFVRLRSSLRWDQTEDWSAGLRVRANVLLPNVSERVRLLITRDEDVSGDFRDGPAADDAEDRTRLGLRFIASERVRSQLDFDGTVRVTTSGLNPRLRARYRYVHGLSENTLGRATQSVFWERSEGFGTTSRLDWEWLPDRDRLVRWTGQGTWSESSSGIDWRTSVIDFRQLSPRTAIRSEVGVFGYTSPSFEVEEYFVAFRYRRQFLRNWLFYELQPEHAWPLDPDTGDRRRDWRMTFTLEIQFENRVSRAQRLREYLGDDAEFGEILTIDDPIPVDAPCERALDPVLLNDDELEAEPDEDLKAEEESEREDEGSGR